MASSTAPRWHVRSPRALPALYAASTCSTTPAQSLYKHPPTAIETPTWAVLFVAPPVPIRSTPLTVHPSGEARSGDRALACSVQGPHVKRRLHSTLDLLGWRRVHPDQRRRTKKFRLIYIYEANGPQMGYMQRIHIMGSCSSSKQCNPCPKLKHPPPRFYCCRIKGTLRY